MAKSQGHCYPRRQELPFKWNSTYYFNVIPVLSNSALKTNTIAQFRVLDFGMEKCEIFFNISTPDVMSSEDSRWIPFNREFKSSALDPSTPIPIDVYRLSSDKVLDVLNLSWKTKPATESFLGTFDVAEGMATHTPTFYCPSDSLQTFEFRCGSGMQGADDCKVDWWQDMHDSLGMHFESLFSAEV